MVTKSSFSTEENPVCIADTEWKLAPTEHHDLYASHCTLHSEHLTQNTVSFTLHTAHCKLHTAHYISGVWSILLRNSTFQCKRMLDDMKLEDSLPKERWTITTQSNLSRDSKGLLI